MSIKSIENLSNEIFYEIFEYLDGCHIYHSFSNLNYRFQQLINSSSLLFKLELPDSDQTTIFMENYQQILHLNKHQIFSIHLWSMENINKVIFSLIFDSSFISLRSILFYSIETEVLLSILPQLSYLPHLISLSIEIWCTQHDPNDVYQFIFQLPKLKYLCYKTTDCHDFDFPLSLSIATCQQQTSIKSLIINHPYTFHDLFAILSYTPHLRLLKFLNVTRRFINIETMIPMILPNLTQLLLTIYENMSFDEFEMLINKLNGNIKVLSLTTSYEDIAYLDANRWERFILNKLPQLEKFYLKYTVYFTENYDVPIYLGERNQFNSSFWIQRQWILDVEQLYEDQIYSISPYK